MNDVHVDIGTAARAHFATTDVVMARLMDVVGPYGLLPDLDCTPFRALARAIAHQQLHGTAAKSILARLVSTCGRGSFPTPQRLLAIPESELRAIGFSYAKIAALRDLAEKCIQGVVPSRRELERLSDAEIIERVTQVRGVGRWTVEMMLMFQLGRPDVLPVDDFGVRNGFRLAYGLEEMPAPRALAAYGERWRPYRSVASWYLWRAVELAREGRLPPPAEKIRLPRLLRVRRKVAARLEQLRTARKKRARK